MSRFDTSVPREEPPADEPTEAVEVADEIAAIAEAEDIGEPTADPTEPTSEAATGAESLQEEQPTGPAVPEPLVRSWGGIPQYVCPEEANGCFFDTTRSEDKYREHWLQVHYVPERVTRQRRPPVNLDIPAEEAQRF